jgi:hypothetical protein
VSTVGKRQIPRPDAKISAENGAEGTTPRYEAPAQMREAKAFSARNLIFAEDFAKSLEHRIRHVQREAPQMHLLPGEPRFRQRMRMPMWNHVALASRSQIADSCSCLSSAWKQLKREITEPEGHTRKHLEDTDGAKIGRCLAALPKFFRAR